MQDPQRSTAVNILLVDDDEFNRRLVKLVLEKQGYLVDSATNGIEALHLLEQQSYALILMDCIMPEMDGYEAVRRYRQREAEQGTARRPVIAFTANSGDQYVQRCTEAGMDDVLSKPFTAPDLIAKVRQWCAA